GYITVQQEYIKVVSIINYYQSYNHTLMEFDRYYNTKIKNGNNAQDVKKNQNCHIFPVTLSNKTAVLTGLF
uniref:hypothetical protein n=1 Tax=Streptococcus anginosus TaxID=1328 RepID=UPI002ED7BEB1